VRGPEWLSKDNDAISAVVRRLRFTKKQPELTEEIE
jgi:hypothetical protein